MTLAKGTVLDVYEIISLLGTGGMGEVYKARDKRLERVVALKVIHSNTATTQESIRRFQQEARAASALNHPNIITIYALGETILPTNSENNELKESQTIQFIATEFIEGQTLRQYMKNSSKDICELLDIFVQVASALSEAHKVGIIHRDIKPENIMIRSDGYVKVLDFGLAKLIERRETVDVEGETEKIFTEPGVIMGTVQYMSPEQAQGSRLNAQTDIFSLGIVLYEMIAGVAPFRGSTVSHTLVAIMEQPTPSITPHAKIPEILEKVINKALEKKTTLRYQTAKDLINDLKKIKQKLENDTTLLESIKLGAINSLPKAKNQLPLTLAGENQTIKDSVEIKSSSKSTLDQSTVTKNDSLKLSNQNLNDKLTVKKNYYLLIVSLIAVFISVGAFGYYKVFNQSQQTNNVPIDSIAVMPFSNDSNDINLEYLSDGLTENLINSFSLFPNLKVKSRNLVFSYKNKNLDTKTLAKELKVRAILLGRVITQGENVSIHTELIDTSDNTQLWGKIYEGKVKDIYALQEEISKNISERLSELTGKTNKTLDSANSTSNSEAYNLYLKGLYAWNKRTPKQTKIALDFFKQAIELDPTYTSSQVGLSDCYNLLGTYVLTPPDEIFPKAKAAAENALKITPKFAKAHTSLGYALTNYYWDFPKAESSFQEAIRLDQTYATAHHWYGLHLLILGKTEEAINELNIALQNDPISLIINTNLGLAYSISGEEEKAIEQLKKTLELEPGFALAHYRLGEIYLNKALFNEAIAEFQKAVELSEDDLRLLSALGFAQAQAGNKPEAIKVLKKLEELSKNRYVSPFDFAVIHLGLGKNDLAFDYLEKALKIRDPRIIWLKIDSKMNLLKNEPNFKNILKACGLEK
jgi:serine/threonine protein kinase/Tfp pilus assembly protein PilF